MLPNPTVFSLSGIMKRGICPFRQTTLVKSDICLFCSAGDFPRFMSYLDKNASIASAVACAPPSFFISSLKSFAVSR